jgi:hypothetical protein
MLMEILPQPYVQAPGNSIDYYWMAIREIDYIFSGTELAQLVIVAWRIELK